MAEVVCPGKTFEAINEGSEPEEFWASLGGKGAVSKMSDALPKPILSPRLFHCKISLLSGKFRAYEIFNFDRDVRINQYHELFFVNLSLLLMVIR